MIEVHPENTDVEEVVSQASQDGNAVFFHAGIYNVNLLIEDCLGVSLLGAGKNTTKIRTVNTSPALRTNGLWFSRIQGLQFTAANAIPCVVDIDGAQSGARGVQGNTFSDCMVVGHETGGAKCDYGLRINRLGQNTSQGSENQFYNCHFFGCSKACVRIDGFNAINNQFYGGNFQFYDKHGMELQGCNTHLHGVGFQSTVGHQQVDNDGWDIAAYFGGSYIPMSVIGCRTESWRFIRTSASQPAVILGCCQAPAGSAPANWTKAFNAVDAQNAYIRASRFHYTVKNMQIDGKDMPINVSPHH